MPQVQIDILKPHVGQEEILSQAKRYNVLECGRRFGKTQLGVYLLVMAALKGKSVAWFAPTYKFLADPWRDAQRILKPLIKSSNKTESRVELLTDGLIDFWSLDNPDSGRGRKYHLVIIDEASIVAYLEQAWQETIRPTLTDYKGDAWFLGTPKGRNYFHRLFTKGETGEKDWTAWRKGTVDNPFISKDEIESAKRELPESVFNQEYLGIPADDGGNPFGLKAIHDCFGSMSIEPPVCFGVDLAKSQDWTVVVGLDRYGNVCTLERWQGDWGSTRTKILSMINGWPTLIDSTGVGDPIVEDIQRVRPNVKGFHFSSTSKQQLMEGLAAYIQQQKVTIPDNWLARELESFEYEYTRTGIRYSAPQGLHDDGVCALALAVKQLAVPELQVNFVSAELFGHDDDNNIQWRELT